MYDHIEILYTCEYVFECETCEYYHLCKLCFNDYFNFNELNEFATIHYAEGEI